MIVLIKFLMRQFLILVCCLPLKLMAQDSTFVVNDSVIAVVKIEYLDKNWKVVPKEKSVFYRKNYTFNNVPYAPIFDEFKGCTLKSTVNVDSIQIGKPKLLDGDFYWYDKKNRLVGEFHYSNGDAVGLEKNFRNYFFFFLFHKVRICEEVDHNKKHPNFSYSYYYKEFRLNGTVKFEGYYRNGDKNIALYEYDY